MYRLHYSLSRMGGRPACGNRRGTHSTDDASKVECTRCLKMMARWAEMKQAKAIKAFGRAMAGVS